MKEQKKHEEVRKQLRKDIQEVRVGANDNNESQIRAQSIKPSLLPSGTTVGAQCLQSL